MKQKNTVITYLVLSIIGVLFIFIIVAFFSQNETDSIGIFDRMVIGGAFITSCALGLSLALRPGWIARMTEKKAEKINISFNQFERRKRIGHHPDCQVFLSHVLRTKRKPLCAGCTGLALGSIVSIFFMTIYVVFPFGLPSTVLYLLIALGMIFIAFNYVEIVNPKKIPLMHLLSNIILLVGFLLIIIGIFQLTGSLGYGLFTVIISFLWLDTRIQLSKWYHARTCRNCTQLCKTY